MLVKISSDDPIFEQAITLLKLKYRTGANSKAAKKALYDFYKMEIENEILRGHNDSMIDEIDRLRELLNLYKNFKTSAKWNYFK